VQAEADALFGSLLAAAAAIEGENHGESQGGAPPAATAAGSDCDRAASLTGALGASEPVTPVGALAQQLSGSAPAPSSSRPRSAAKATSSKQARGAVARLSLPLSEDGEDAVAAQGGDMAVLAAAASMSAEDNGRKAAGKSKTAWSKTESELLSK
jgi:hypothetical protein